MRIRNGKVFGLSLLVGMAFLVGGCAIFAPEPVARFEVSPVVIYAGEDVTFDGSFSNSGRSIISYTWEFGDGVTTFGRRATHAYAEPGRYRATLKVKDSAGNTGRVNEEIVVYLRSGSEVFHEDFSSGSQALTQWALDPTWASAQEGAVENLFREPILNTFIIFTSNFSHLKEIFQSYPVRK